LQPLFLQCAHRNKRFCSLRCSIVLSYRATETIFTGIRQIFLVVIFVSVVFAAKQNFGLGTVLLPFLVPELQKPSSPVLEPRSVFRSFSLCFGSLFAQINNFGLRAVFSIVLSIRFTETIFTGTRTYVRFSGFWPLFRQSPLRNKQLWSWRRSSIMLSVRATGTALRTLFRSFGPPVFSSWSQGISLPSLVQIGFSVLEL
jgi:hypothetical protein